MVFQYDKLKGIETSEKQDNMEFPYFMSAITDDEDNNLWMVTYAEGVWRYDGEKLSNYPVNDNGKSVFLLSIYKDNHGTLWLGTQNAGPLIFNGTTFEKFEAKS